MRIGYTRQQVIDRLEQAKFEMPTLYNQKFCNWRGQTIDTNEYYSEVIAEWLIGNLQLFDIIEPITRKTTYKIPTHNGTTPRESIDESEERLAMTLYRQGVLPILGDVKDYQTPLRKMISDKARAIDLLAYDGTVLRILELKAPQSVETMLRSVLEGYTYLKIVDVTNLLDNFELPPSTEVKACPLVSRNGLQYSEMQNRMPYLKNLMKLLDCEPYYYEKEGELYIVTQY